MIFLSSIICVTVDVIRFPPNTSSFCVYALYFEEVRVVHPAKSAHVVLFNVTTLLMLTLLLALKRHVTMLMLHHCFLVELPEAEKLMLALCCHDDRRAAWKAFYFESLSSGKHFLEQLVVRVFSIHTFRADIFIRWGASTWCGTMELLWVADERRN